MKSKWIWALGGMGAIAILLIVWGLLDLIGGKAEAEGMLQPSAVAVLPTALFSATPLSTETLIPTLTTTLTATPAQTDTSQPTETIDAALATGIAAQATDEACEKVSVTAKATDTLSKIAKIYGVSVDVIRKYNGLPGNDDFVFEGQKLKIPLCERIPTATATATITKIPTRTPLPTLTIGPTRTPWPTQESQPTAQPTSPPSGGFDPKKPTALCKDGIYSYSQRRSGTCSGHGGVKTWLQNPP